MGREDEHEHHKGSFAEGQADEEKHAEDEEGPDFARGQQQKPDRPQDEEHKGSFAEGQAEEEKHPEDEPGPDFARGQDED